LEKNNLSIAIPFYEASPQLAYTIPQGCRVFFLVNMRSINKFMNEMINIVVGWYRLLRRTSIILTLLVAIAIIGFGGQLPAWAGLAQGDAITDPQAILRYALPFKNESVRKLQKDLEGIADELRGKRWSNIKRNVKDASYILTNRRDRLLSTVPENLQTQQSSTIDLLAEGVGELQELIDTKDREAITLKRKELLTFVTELEESMVEGYPFAVPEEYANLPQLLGRATVAMKTTQGDLEIVIDGYSAPVNGGNFVDLVQRGFYDNMNFVRAEDYYILQAGDPPGEDEGFIDPKTKQYRSIPMEVLVEGDAEPVYGVTLEELGRYLDKPVIPFNAYGAIALARPENDPNGGSSQFFFFKFDTELTPPGFNLMDGRYAVFGYVVKGKKVLEELTAQDKIVSAKVIQGIENLKEPS
jgi:peptidylprolyl isomerase